MDTESLQILRKVMCLAGDDWEYQALLARCRELEGDYSEVMEALPAGQREMVDAYFLACTNMEIRMMLLAYRCGQQENRGILRLR